MTEFKYQESKGRREDTTLRSDQLSSFIRIKNRDFKKVICKKLIKIIFEKGNIPYETFMSPQLRSLK